MAKPTSGAGEALLTTKQVCRLLGVSRQTLYVWMHQGRFPQPLDEHRAGKTSRWPESVARERLAKRPQSVAKSALRELLDEAGAGPLIDGCDGALLGYTRVGDELRAVYDRAEAVRLLEAYGVAQPQAWTHSPDARGVVWVERELPDSGVVSETIRD